MVTLVPAGRRHETSRTMGGAGIEPTVTEVRSGEAEQSRISGAKTPSGIPLDGEPAVPRPKSVNAPFHGLGTSKGTSRGAGGTYRRAVEAHKLAEARGAALVRRNVPRAVGPRSLATGSTTLGST